MWPVQNITGISGKTSNSHSLGDERNQAGHPPVFSFPYSGRSCDSLRRPGLSVRRRAPHERRAGVAQPPAFLVPGAHVQGHVDFAVGVAAPHLASVEAQPPAFGNGLALEADALEQLLAGGEVGPARTGCAGCGYLSRGRAAALKATRGSL